MKTPSQFNDSSSLSRRQWIRSGLTTCGYLAAGGLALGQSEAREHDARVSKRTFIRIHVSEGLFDRFGLAQPQEAPEDERSCLHRERVLCDDGLSLPLAAFRAAPLEVHAITRLG